MPSFKRFVRSDDGQDLIEYALIAGFICMAAALGVMRAGAGVRDTYQTIRTGLEHRSPDNTADDGARVTMNPPTVNVEPCAPPPDDQRDGRCRATTLGK